MQRDGQTLPRGDAVSEVRISTVDQWGDVVQNLIEHIHVYSKEPLEFFCMTKGARVTVLLEKSVKDAVHLSQSQVVLHPHLWRIPSLSL